MGLTLVLGRDGMGDADEADYEAWVSYVTAHIDERAGFEVQVEGRAARDVQDDEIRGGSDEQCDAVDEAKQALWNEWCAEGAARASGGLDDEHTEDEEDNRKAVAGMCGLTVALDD